MLLQESSLCINRIPFSEGLDMDEKHQVQQVHFGDGDNVAGDKYVVILGEKIDISSVTDSQAGTFLKQLENEFSILPMLGVGKELDIEKIFITLTIAPENISGEKIDIDTKGVTISNPIEEIYLNRDLGSPHRLSWGTSIPLHSILFHKKAVVLGEPGAGKTTLFKRLLIDICKGIVCAGNIPLYVKLSDITSFSSRFFGNYLRNKYPNYYAIIALAIERGNAVLFFDGFDEVLGHEQQVVNDIISTLSSKGNRILISCRTTVFPRNVLASDFKIFECMGFNLAQRRKFITNWFFDRPEMGLRIEEEISGNPNIFGISHNPLLLSLIAMQFETNPNFSLPRERINIYIDSIKVLIAKREHSNAFEFSNESKFELLENISYQMSIKNIEVIASAELMHIVFSWIKDQPFADNRITENSIETWLVNDGIIQKQSFGQFRFLHLTLQEALTASYIKRKKSPIHYIEKYIVIPKWEETIRLLFSLLNLDEVNAACALLENMTEASTDRKHFIISTGRYISDFAYANHKFYTTVFSGLVSFIFDDFLKIDYNDIIISLASMCNAHPNYLIAIMEFMRERLNNTYVLYAYINILRLSPSQDSACELVNLFNHFENSSVKHDLLVEILGHIIEALEYLYNDELWENLYSKFINVGISNDCSHLSAITASSLGRVQSKRVFELIKNRLFVSEISILDCSILYKYEDIEVNRELIRFAYANESNSYLACFFSGLPDCLADFSTDELEKILKNVRSSAIAAYMLSNIQLFVGKPELRCTRALITDKSHSLVIRCAALENFLVVNANDPGQLNWATSEMDRTNLEEYYLVAINTMPRVHCGVITEYLLRKVKKGSCSDKVVRSLARYLSTTTLNTVNPISWLLARTKEYASESNISLLSILALARHKYPMVIFLINDYIKASALSGTSMMAICKALALSDTEASAYKLLEILEAQTDINFIGSIIALLGQQNFPFIEDKFLNYLDSKNWPDYWPAPLPALRKGEQRPTDMRKINLIVSLKKMNSYRSIPSLQAISADENESADVRYSANIAIRNLCWNSHPLQILNKSDSLDQEK